MHLREGAQRTRTLEGRERQRQVLPCLLQLNQRADAAEVRARDAPRVLQ